ncbi:hypothetical protein WEI85_39890 [Actinomycetes bacterium KLBMP 9797]
MTSNHLPVPGHDQAGPAARRSGAHPVPQRDTGRLPAPRASGGLPPPVHDPGALGLVDLPGRDYWWERIGTPVRDRMVARVGPIVEWWAYCHHTDQRRPYAVVFGERGLAVCTPTVNDRGGPAQLVTVVPFVPASLRHAVVVQKPRRPTRGHPALPGSGADAEVAARATVDLPARVRGFLGNLPAEAQSRLQWPFANGDPIRDSDYHYSGSSDELDIWCYLAGSRSVTFVSGHGTGLSGPAHRASWRLICRQAEVATP